MRGLACWAAAGCPDRTARPRHPLRNAMSSRRLVSTSRASSERAFSTLWRARPLGRPDPSVPIIHPAVRVGNWTSAAVTGNISTPRSRGQKRGSAMASKIHLAGPRDLTLCGKRVPAKLIVSEHREATCHTCLSTDEEPHQRLVGSRVIHRLFGTGEVLVATGTRTDPALIVSFSTGRKVCRPNEIVQPEAR
jgi:hypothetical protein